MVPVEDRLVCGTISRKAKLSLFCDATDTTRRKAKGTGNETDSGTQ